MTKESFENLRVNIDSALQEFMNDQSLTIKDNEFFTYYYEQISNFLFSGGKRFRPVLMAVSAAAVNPKILGKDLFRVSLSLELLHNASLIHDDIMDKAESRRGIKAFHCTFRDYATEMYSSKNTDVLNYGLSMGILGGDFAYNLAYKAIQEGKFNAETKLKAYQEFNEGFMSIVKGVILETDMMNKFEVTEKQYIEMNKRKTAALFEKSARIGAIFAGGTESQIESLGNYGKNAGIAFQIVDDVIGTFGDPAKTGKPVDSDIKEGKKTILLIKAIENSTEEQQKMLNKIVGNRSATQEEIEQVCLIMKETGAVDYAKKKAEKLYKMSIDFLEKASPKLNIHYKELLINISKMGVYREK